MSRRVTVLAGTALLATLPSQGATAQQDPSDERRIVVTGEREPATKSQIADQARNISIIGSPLDNPLPRFEDRICPGVLGLEAEGAGYINDRIRHNAERFDLQLHKDDGKCEPNFIVAFVDDPQGQLSQLARRQGYMLAGLSTDSRGELLDASAVARVWTNTVMKTNTGAPAPSRSSNSAAPERAFSYNEAAADGEVGGETRLTLPPEARGNASHSRIYFPLREDIFSVLIVFDRAKVRGKSLLQLADYATMRGLAFTRETRDEVAADTILSLFDGDGPKPERLTAFDLGYLGSLYDGIPNIPAQSKLANVDRHIARQQEVAEGEAEAE